MRNLKIIPAVLAMTTLAALATAGTASATTLEVNGVTQNKSVSISASLEAGTSTIVRTTSGEVISSCTGSAMGLSTESPFTGTSVAGSLATLSFSGCTSPITVHKKGKLSIEHIAASTEGDVYSEGKEITIYWPPVGAYINCKTSRTKLGRLKGVAKFVARLIVEAIISCGFFVPSAKWETTYTVTSPEGLGVSA